MAANLTNNGSTLNCTFCGNYLFDSPRQAGCGDRLCGACFSNYQSRGKEELRCPTCGETINLDKCFRDKAADSELATALLHCTNKGCPWEGQGSHYKKHFQQCKFAIVKCPNIGCLERMYRSDLDLHFKSCRFTISQWPNHHGNTGMETHNSAQVLQMFKNSTKQDRQEFELVSRSIDAKLGGYDKEVEALRSEIERLKTELNSSVQPVVQTVMKLETTVQQLQDGFGEMALLLQTLQATSYNGVFIWKIPEIQRRRQEAKMGRTVSLYSAPFYTSRHGYKLCLRLYMDGDGSGKGNHLSFFLTLMKGEFDALLPWPFKQTVSLILLDQDRQRDIIQSFRPEPSSASFQRPRMEMNVASGCPNFAPLAVLKNTSYVKDDTMFLKCVIDRSGLDNT